MYGLLAQLGERLGHNQNATGSSPVQTTTHDPLAQLGERLGDNQKVIGSSPIWVTNEKP